MHRRRERGHSLRLASALAAILTLGSSAPAAYAEETLSFLGGSVDAVVAASHKPDHKPSPSPDPTPEPSPDPTPEPSPDPTPEPTPDPTPEPSPDPTPEPSPDPTPEPTPDPTPEAPSGKTSTGLFGPGLTSSRESIIGESAQNDSGIVPENEEDVQGGAGSLVQAVSSILQELAAAGDAAVAAAEDTSLCPGSECGSTFAAKRWGAMALALICLLLAVAGFAIRVRRRRSNTDPVEAQGPAQQSAVRL